MQIIIAIGGEQTMPRKKVLKTDDYTGAFPSRLREIMALQGKTQQEVADAVGKTRQAIGYYADGTSSPDWKTIVILAKYFSVSSDWLLGLSEFKSRENEQVLAKDLGLSEESIKVLKEYMEAFNGTVLVPTVNLLITQETLAPLNPHITGCSEEECDKMEEMAVDEWIEKDYVPILRKIEEFLLIRRDGKITHYITDIGGIEQIRNNKILWHALRTIPASDIAERILLSDIEDGLKKIKEKEA